MVLVLRKATCAITNMPFSKMSEVTRHFENRSVTVNIIYRQVTSSYQEASSSQPSVARVTVTWQLLEKRIGRGIPPERETRGESD